MTRVSPLPHHDEQQVATGGGALSVANIIDRSIGFLRLDDPTYEEVEHDKERRMRSGELVDATLCRMDAHE